MKNPLEVMNHLDNNQKKRGSDKLWFRFARSAYKVLQPYPRIMRAMERLNDRLHLIEDPSELRQKEQRELRKYPADINVAMVVDTFTYNSLQYECNAFPVEPGNWKDIFAENDIDFFFCESAWAGIDSEKRPWRGSVYTSVNFQRENRTALLNILKYCRNYRIPTVFWNKEDPTHYEDKVHDFVSTAVLFDHIFTTDADCVQRYKKEYGHRSVHVLEFATQPRLFNPIQKYERTEEVVFAGSWYKQHPARSKEMEHILDSILASPYGLKIYNRHYGDPDPNHQFPGKYNPYILPSLPHSQLDIAYKGSRYALNINTVTESTTMFARRVFELMSSNTLVISNPSVGVKERFGDHVLFTKGETPLEIRNEKENRAWCLQSVLRYHTYKQRFIKILKDIRFPYEEDRKLVSVAYKVSSYQEAKESTAHFQHLRGERQQCLLIIKNNCNPGEIQFIVNEFNDGETMAVVEKYFQKDQNAIFPYADYYMNATVELEKNFIDEALLHVQYLDSDIPVVAGKEQYTFGMATIRHMLLPASKSKMLFEEISFETNAYRI